MTVFYCVVVVGSNGVVKARNLLLTFYFSHIMRAVRYYHKYNNNRNDDDDYKDYLP